MAEAEEQALRLLGPDTRIHGFKKVRRPGFLGILRSAQVEVLASRRGALKTDPKPKGKVKSDKDRVYDRRRRIVSRLDEATDQVRNIFDGVNALTKLFTYMKNAGISESLASGLALDLRSSLPPGLMREFGFVKEHLRQKIRKMIKTSHGFGRELGRHTAVLLGPTGVGKTTTVAKLAAQIHLLHGRETTIVTTDTFRVGAVDQIRRYANAIGIPWQIATNGQDLVDKVKAVEGDGVVIVDTAGLGSRERRWIGEMHGAIKDIGSCSTYMLLNMGAHRANQAEVFKKFSPLRIDYLILTKADECAAHGQILDILAYTGIPVAFITNGQNVPGDIDIAREGALTDLILGEEFNKL